MLCAQCTGELPDSEVCPHCGESPLLQARYELLEVVGHGATGTTYRARRQSDGAVVAIKELMVRKVESLKAIDLFQREVRVLRELSHPGVPRFIEELHDDAGRSVSLYLVQEFIDGSTLDAEFEQHRGTVDEVFAVAADILDTLAYLHSLRPPVIHRDIKPANIMRRGATGELVLIDFGSVRDAVDTAEGGSTVAGTFGYMAPEQFSGRALPATDIYGVGATIVALLSRQDPQTLVGDDRTIQWRGRLGLSQPLQAILGKMLAPIVEERASDAAALAAEIRAVLRGEHPIAAAQAPPTLPDVPPAPRKLPPKFDKQWAANSSFNVMFGGIFSLVGIFSAAIPIIVAVSTGEWFPVLMAILFFAIFGGLGFGFLSTGLKRRSAARVAYREGVPAEALITSVGGSSYQVNGRSATVYHYEFAAGGQLHSGEHHSWDALDLNVGSTVVVLHSAEDPSKNVMWDPNRHSVRELLRPQLVEQRRRLEQRAAEQQSKVVLDFAEQDEQVEQAESSGR